MMKMMIKKVREIGSAKNLGGFIPEEKKVHSLQVPAASPFPVTLTDPYPDTSSHQNIIPATLEIVPNLTLVPPGVMNSFIHSCKEVEH